MYDKSLQSMSHLAVSSPQYRPRRHNLLHTNSTSSLNTALAGHQQQRTRVRPRPRPKTLEVTLEKSKSNIFVSQSLFLGNPSSTLSEYDHFIREVKRMLLCLLHDMFSEFSSLNCTKNVQDNFCIMLQILIGFCGFWFWTFIQKS